MASRVDFPTVPAGVVVRCVVPEVAVVLDCFAAAVVRALGPFVLLPGVVALGKLGAAVVVVVSFSGSSSLDTLCDGGGSDGM